MKDAALWAWLALSHMSGMGPIRMHRLYAAYPDFLTCFEGTRLSAQGRALLTALGVRPTLELAAITRDWEWAQQPARALIPVWDPRYPALLKETAGAPPILYVEGAISALQQPCLGVVGARQATAIGQQLAYRFARALSAANFSIVSGLAKGIDTAAHQGACATPEGRTVAVLGHGLDRIYPAENQTLAEKILAQGGAWVSEFSIGTPPAPGHFPRRNRIISGLSQGVLVIEATEKSGSLSTAHHAADQGREVFAVPGPIYSPQSKGCHQLIRTGATLVESPQQIFEALHG